MNIKLNELERACLASNAANVRLHEAENNFADAWDRYVAAIYSGNNYHAANRGVDVAHAARAAARAASTAANNAVLDAHDSYFAEKELEKLEENADAALTIYLSTPLDSATSVLTYKKYKAAYAALSYARCFNLDASTLTTTNKETNKMNAKLNELDAASESAWCAAREAWDISAACNAVILNATREEWDDAAARSSAACATYVVAREAARAIDRLRDARTD